MRPFSDVIFDRSRSDCNWEVDFVFGTGFIRVFMVRKKQLVLAIFMLEKIEDAFLLHEPSNEIEIRLTVLHTVIPLFVAETQTQLKVTEPQIFKDRLNDLRH